MIQYKTGDLLKEETEGVVNTVNCVGVMGRGIALQFKKQYPENFKEYARACKQKQVVPGKMLVQKTHTLSGAQYIINFPTKRDWRGKSRIEDIESGLEDLVKVIQKLEIKSIAIPPLGCGLGGLDWNEVKQRIEYTLGILDGVQVVIFEPSGAPEALKMARSATKPKMTKGRAALVSLIKGYLDGGLDQGITLLEVHKLMYFLQMIGEHLRLEYKEASHGPYAENLSHVLNHVEGHLISGYADGGDSPAKELNLIEGASQKAVSFLEDHKETVQRCNRVFDLVEGFEDSFGMELLATVHWVVKKKHVKSLDDAIKAVYDWGPQKKKFTERQIKIAYETLKEKGWIEV